MEDLNNELHMLHNWFCTYYLEHEPKYRRFIDLDKLCDDGSNPKDKLMELQLEAEVKRKRIQELEVLIEKSANK